MGWMMAGAQAVGGLLSAGAASDAASAQVAAAQRAQDTQKAMFDTVNGQQAPYRQAGYNALNALTQGFGGTPTSAGSSGAMTGGTAAIPGTEGHYGITGPDGTMGWVDGTPGTAAIPGTMSGGADQSGFTGIGSGQFSHQFNAGDLNANLAPNYKFMLDQGLGATNNQASVNGGLVGGNALKGINDYAQNYAQNGYQQAYNNYNSNQTNIFNRLSNIAGLGQTANNNTGNVGMNLAGNIGSAQMAGGAADAAGIMGGNKALVGGINGAAASMWGNMGGNSGNGSLSNYQSTMGIPGTY